METTIGLYKDYRDWIGITKKKMETTIVIEGGEYSLLLGLLDWVSKLPASNIHIVTLKYPSHSHHEPTFEAPLILKMKKICELQGSESNK